MNTKQQLGRDGEELVADDLRQRGFEVLDQNLYSRYGEIDVLAMHEGVLHIVEVKTRSSDAFGHPVETLTRDKVRKLTKTLKQLHAQGVVARAPFQVDFAAVLWPRDGEPSIEWFWNIGLQDLTR